MKLSAAALSDGLTTAFFILGLFYLTDLLLGKVSAPTDGIALASVIGIGAVLGSAWRKWDKS